VKSGFALPTWSGAATVLLVAAIAHLSFYWATDAILWPDSIRYAELSSNLPHRLATGNWDIWTTPAYPVFLWLVKLQSRSVEGLILIQQCLAVSTCFLLWLSARKMFGARAALIGALLAALSPARHYYAQAILSEPLAEFLVVGGFAALSAAIDAPLGRFLVWRALAGAAFGAATLTRPNLATAAIAAILAPIAPRAERRRAGLCWGMLCTAVATTAVVAPWLVFNMQRGVSGPTGNLGYQMNEFANKLQIDGRVDLQALEPYTAVKYTAEKDRELVGVALRRFTSAPRAYLRAVVTTAVVLFDSSRGEGDVSPYVSRCQVPPEVTNALPPTLAGFNQVQQHPPSAWRCAIHGRLARPFALLTAAGWIGVGAWLTASLFTGRLDLALLASLPIVCVAALCLIVQANARYAFPCESLALGIGLPAGVAVLRFRAQVNERCGSVGRRSRGIGESPAGSHDIAS
jgi:4-amino-4-deoxy-L-arabinose transferase-like glycosyltransferase